MHIVSASRRTDIPAFHAEWLMNRIRAGGALVRSPFGGRLYEVSLNTEDVIAIVFWTKNAGPLARHLDELSDRGYDFSFLYTVNNYPDFLEPNVPGLSQTLSVLEELNKRGERAIVRWRYDTIVLTEELTPQQHLLNFRRLCRLMAPFSKECIFSFCDYYKKTRRNMERLAPDYIEPTLEERRQIANEMAGIASDHDITLSACADDSLVSEKVGKGRCIDPHWLKDLVRSREKLNRLSELKMRPSRKGCACVESKDIGAYDTCSHGCVYCYANANLEAAAGNIRLIDSKNPCLAPSSTIRKAQA